jgi:hypothetical protein
MQVRVVDHRSQDLLCIPLSLVDSQLGWTGHAYLGSIRVKDVSVDIVECRNRVPTWILTAFLQAPTGNPFLLTNSLYHLEYVYLHISFGPVTGSK